MPEIVCSVHTCGIQQSVTPLETAAMQHTRFSRMAGLSPPRINFCAAAVKSFNPAIGRYSWLTEGSVRRASSACTRARVSASGLHTPPPSLSVCLRLLCLSYLLNNRQNPRLRIIIPISTDAQINFLVRGILTVGAHQSEEGIFWGSGDSVGREDGGGGGGSHDVGSDGAETVASCSGWRRRRCKLWW